MLKVLEVRTALVSDGCGSTTLVEPFTEGEWCSSERRTPLRSWLHDGMINTNKDDRISMTRIALKSNQR
jgi:hypothetical protein